MTHPGQLLKQAGIYAGKELGQNFLSDPNTARMIVEKTGISEDTHVLEIGPGLGALTLPIAKKAFHVTAVEKDGRLLQILRQVIDDEGLNNIDIIQKILLKIKNLWSLEIFPIIFHLRSCLNWWKKEGISKRHF